MEAVITNIKAGTIEAIEVDRVFLGGVEQRQVLEFDTIEGRVDTIGVSAVDGWSVKSAFGTVTFTANDSYTAPDAGSGEGLG